MENKQSRIMIAGTNSGCGKTTITCAILQALINRKMRVASFKVGPDYIDPMFHSEIIGVKSRNLDMFLCGEEVTRYLFAKNSQDADISIVEGVMGFYDGLGVDSLDYSSCDLSNKTETPVILLVNCTGMSYSIVAMIKGYLEFYANKVVGVILNNTSKGMYEKYKECIEKSLNIQVLGFMPKQKEAVFESRHLGLITAQEIDSLHEKLEQLAKMAEENLELDRIIALANKAAPLNYFDIQIEKLHDVKIAIAWDKAFCFYYEDSLELLRQMGATLIPFSPMKEACLPPDINGLILGGGYPELYLEELQENKTMLESIKIMLNRGLPIYAECGGFMYLGKTITVKEQSYQMVGAIDTHSVLTQKLQNFGYVTLESNEDNLFCEKGQGIRGHEFHYSSSDQNGTAFKAVKKTNKSWEVGFTTTTYYAGYPHMHLWGNLDFAKNFIEKCWDYKQKMSAFD